MTALPEFLRPTSPWLAEEFGVPLAAPEPRRRNGSAGAVESIHYIPDAARKKALESRIRRYGK